MLDNARNAIAAKIELMLAINTIYETGSTSCLPHYTFNVNVFLQGAQS